MKALPGPKLAERTTLRLGGRALAEIVLEEEDDAGRLPDELSKHGGKPVMLGKGSNILAADGELELVIVSTAMKKPPEILSQDFIGAVVLRAEAGCVLSQLLATAAKRGLTGLEGLAGIPGSVGGAAAMNAGSFGCEIKDVLKSVRIYSPERGIRDLGPDDLELGYRTFRPKTGERFFIVLSIDVELRRERPERVRARMKEYAAKKKASQPVTAWSAGCVFRNPSPQQPAGKLLQDAGLKGMRKGDMAFSKLHANFMINQGNGKSDEAFELIETAKERVRERFGVELETEVALWL